MEIVKRDVARKKLDCIFSASYLFGFEYWGSYIEVHLSNSYPAHPHLSIVSYSDIELLNKGSSIRWARNAREFVSALSDLQAEDANKFLLTEDCSLVLSFSDVDLAIKSMVSVPGFEWIEQQWAVYSCNYSIEGQRSREMIALFDGVDIYLKQDRENIDS